MNQLQCGQELHGFIVTRKRESSKLGGTFYEMVHRKTGAELCFADNGAENKLFSVAFKTIPENSTGVFHILEHSVLCGSRKFPVREPFLELLKGSMNTFLNAFTFPDKTVYPVSSRNEKDFLNLTEVYLDAVFAPLLLENEQIFRQEGRHLEVTKDGPAFNGVVLNEMKGAMSNVDRRIGEGLTALLFPESCYRFNSGGAPDAIPTLTYAQFTDTYHRFYHPSNARFYLDGSLPLDATLALIDSYLAAYDPCPLAIDIAPQTPATAEATNYYESAEVTGPRDILSFARLLGDYQDVTTIFAANVLCDLLAGTNQAPLKRALLSASLCEDVELYTEEDTRQPYITLCVRNTTDGKADAIRETIRSTVKSLLKEGLPQAELTASVNKLEFAMREMEEPQGIVRNLLALRAWLYGGDPMLYLDTAEIFTTLRAMITTGGYETLLEKLFLDANGVVTLHTLPSSTLTAEEAQAAADHAADIWQAMTAEQRAALEQSNHALEAWQTTPDSPEALATLPRLSLADVDPLPRPFVTRASTTEDGVTLLLHPAPAANGVTHLALYLPLTGVDEADLPLLSLLPELYGELPTATHDVAALQRAIKTHIGKIAFNMSVFARHDDTQTATPCLTVTASLLTPELAEAEALVAEMLTATDFSDKARVLEIVKQSDEYNRQSMISSGHAIGVGVVRAAHSAAGAASDALRGFGSMRAVHMLAGQFDEQFPRLLALFRRVTEKWIGKTGLTVSVTAEQPAAPLTLLARLPQGHAQPQSVAYRASYPAKMGISIPAPVSYAAMGYQPALAGHTPDGKLHVAANILSLDYLWNKVRVQGGAYGAGFSNAGNQGVFSYSYRDPSPAATLETFAGMPAYLRAFAAGSEPIDKYIISTIASADPLLSPKSEGLAADKLWFSGITEEIRAANRRDMLATDREALLYWADALDSLKENGTVCVVAREDTLKTLEGLEITAL